MPTMDNIIGGVGANAEHSANCTYGVMALCSKFSNLDYLLIGQLGHGMPHSPETMRAVNAMSFSIKNILAMCAIAKVFKKAMGKNSVKVAGFHFWRRRSYEGQQYETVYIYGRSPSIVRQDYGWITSPAQTWLNNFLWRAYHAPSLFSLFLIVGSHRAVITNIIGRKTRDGFENLWGCVRILVSHGIALLHRGISWLGPHHCVDNDAACSFLPQVYGICN